STPVDASKEAYRAAIVDENVLLKPSLGTRSKTYSYLRDRYGLDPEIPVFRVLRTLWERDESGRPILALLVAAFRDPILRASVPLVLGCGVDEPITSLD